MASLNNVALEADSPLTSALQDLLVLAGMPSVETLSVEEVQAAIDSLKMRLASQPTIEGEPATTPANEANGLEGRMPAVALSPRRHRKVLLVGQVGIILHQLKHVLMPTGSSILLAKDLGDALELYLQECPSLVVIDLCMPTAREGLALLQAIRELVRKGKIMPEPNIIMLSSSNKDKPMHGLCQESGANLILERLDGWQQTIVDICQGASKVS